MKDVKILDQLCLLFDCGRKDLMRRVVSVVSCINAIGDSTEDRLYNAKTKTWWKRVGTDLLAAEAPPDCKSDSELLEIIGSLAERCARQSELLSKRAEASRN